MQGEAALRRIDEIATIADELGSIVPTRGWTKYALKILVKLQELSIELSDDPFVRMDATLADIEWKVSKPEFKPADDLTDEEKAQGFYFREVNGNAIKFSSETGEPIDGQPKAFGVDDLQSMIDNARAKIEAQKEKAAESVRRNREHPRKGYMTCEEPVTFANAGETTKDHLGRDVTHFNHDEDTMEITSPVKVQDVTGNEFEIVPGSIEHLTVFAANGVGRGLDAADGLADQVGGSPESWKHCKGIAKVVGIDGTEREADIHWFESKECGQLEWKIKQFVEDMDESQVYW